MAKGKLGKLGGALGGLFGAGWIRDEARDQYIGPQGQRADALALQKALAQQGQQTLAGIQQQMGDYITYGYTTGTTASIDAYAITAEGTLEWSGHKAKKKAETSLEWLDRRVEEMRVKL